MAQGTFGKLGLGNGPAGSDFLAPDNDLTWGTGTILVDGVAMVSVNEGSLEWTVDEPGGILAATTDTGDNDNAAFFLGPFQPSDGGAWMETRFKFSNADCAIFAGFTQTLALDTPVMPAEFATATMTYNGTGSMAGIQYDVDGTTDDFRAVFADGGAVVASANGAAANGERANATITADRWYVVRVEVHPGGAAEVWFGDIATDKELKLVDVITGGIDADANHYACLMIENRSGAARVLEIDYFYAQGNRDWAVD